MNPTEKLYILLELGHKHDFSKEVQTLIDKGAKLNEEYTSQCGPSVHFSKPLFTAIQTYCHPNIVKTLKDNYYEGPNMESTVYDENGSKVYRIEEYLDYQAHMLHYFAHKSFPRLYDARDYSIEYFDIFGFQIVPKKELKDHFLQLKALVETDSSDEDTDNEEQPEQTD